MGSLVNQDAPLLEKCHHTFHETNSINVLHHGSEIVRIIVGSTKLQLPRRVFHDPIHREQDLVTVDQLGEMHFHIWQGDANQSHFPTRSMQPDGMG